ncbi:MAG TPA: methionyl-tRNA formyltransferase, partial [Candidatus Eisenbacteria bacterium]|nr:methionyl-tRNA formyltransferase [Candidatus Eisenbacteria bacterium]
MGTPEFAVPPLAAVAQACEVTLVVTRPDRPRGRGRHPGASEVAEAARGLGLAVWKPESLRTEEARARLVAERADAFAVVAFGAILPPAVLALPRAGCVNLHGSLLPDYRGAAPIQRALWDGRAETGVSTLFMDEGIDTGDVILTARERVRDDDDAGTLAARLARLGAPLLVESLRLAAAGRAPRASQDRAAGSYARKLGKADGEVDWTLDADTVWRHARAVTPWPGAAARFRDARVILLASRPVAPPHAGAPGELLAVDAAGVVVACGAGAL